MSALRRVDDMPAVATLPRLLSVATVGRLLDYSRTVRAACQVVLVAASARADRRLLRRLAIAGDDEVVTT